MLQEDIIEYLARNPQIVHAACGHHNRLLPQRIDTRVQSGLITFDVHCTSATIAGVLATLWNCQLPKKPHKLLPADALVVRVLKLYDAERMSIFYKPESKMIHIYMPVAVVAVEPSE